MTENNVVCPRCNGNSITLKAKQSDESIREVFVKSEPTFLYDAKTGESSIGNEETSYDFQMYACENCMRLFGIVRKINMRFGEESFSTDGNEIPKKVE